MYCNRAIELCDITVNLGFDKAGVTDSIVAPPIFSKRYKYSGYIQKVDRAI
jgi:hypothetical protein